MKNRNIVHAREEAEIYREYYRPSLNMWRFTKTVLGLLIFGSSAVPASNTITRKRIVR